MIRPPRKAAESSLEEVVDCETNGAMTTGTSTSTSFQISFKSPKRERKARLSAAQLLETLQGPETVFREERQQEAIPHVSTPEAGPFEGLKLQQLKTLAEAANWLAEEGRPGGEDWEAVLSLVFLSHDSREALTRLQLICVRSLATKMRSADRFRAFGDDVCYNYVKLLQPLCSLLTDLSYAKDVHLQVAYRVMASLALKLGILPACSELLAIVKSKAVQPKMRLEEVEMVIAASQLPVELVSHIRSQLTEQRSKPLLNLLVQMLEAMASSNFVEHSVRALLLTWETLKGPHANTIGRTEPSGSDPKGATFKAREIVNIITAMCVVIMSDSITALHISGSEGPRMLAAIKVIMSGPCMQYALAASIVSTLASADGGILYGMTTPLPLITDMLPPLVLLWSWLCEQSPPIKLQLYSPRAVRHVCRRMLDVARMSVVSKAAAQRVALQGRPQPEQASSPSLPKPLPPRISLKLALAALRCYALMCPHLLVQNLRPGGGSWGGPGTIADSPGAAAAAAEYWSEAVSTMSTFLDYVKAVPDSDFMKPYAPNMLARLTVAVGDWDACEPVPPPSPSLIAALAAGYVPLLERSLRALARNISHQSQGHGLTPLLGVFGDQSRMGALLSYGDPHEVASLLATGAKLLKRLLHSDVEEQVKAVQPLVMDWMTVFIQQVMATSDGEPSVIGAPCGSTVRIWVVDLSDRASGTGCDAAASRLEAEGTLQQTSYPSQQAASLILTCLPLWLPPLVALGRLPVVDSMSMLLIPAKCLLWIPALVAAMEIEEGRLQLSRCESSGGPSGNIDTKGRIFGWRRFLLQQLDVVQQIGLCLDTMITGKLKAYGDLYPVMLDMVYQGLRCLMYALPGEVAAGLKDGRLPALTAEQLFRPGTGEVQHVDVENWRILLSQLQVLKKAKTKQFTADSGVQAFWARVPTAANMGSMLMMANCPAATLTTLKGTEASTSQGSMHGQPTRLRLCANPGCDNLAGDSEAMLPLKGCASCGAVWYCRRECQTAHWRAGHKTECGAMRVTQQPRRPPGS